MLYSVLPGTALRPWNKLSDICPLNIQKHLCIQSVTSLYSVSNFNLKFHWKPIHENYILLQTMVLNYF